MVWRNRPFLNGFFRRTQSLGIFGMTVLSLGCLGTTDGSKSDEAVGPQSGGQPMVLDDRPVPPFMGGDADSAPGQPTLGGQPEMGGELPIDIRPCLLCQEAHLRPQRGLSDLTDQWDVGHTKFEMKF